LAVAEAAVLVLMAQPAHNAAAQEALAAVHTVVTPVILFNLVEQEHQVKEITAVADLIMLEVAEVAVEQVVLVETAVQLTVLVVLVPLLIHLGLLLPAQV